MRIAILGAGSVGSVVAWHLVRAGSAPVIVARPESAALLASEGLTLIGDSGPVSVAVAATADPKALGACDLVLVALKAQDWPAALPLLRPLLGPATVLVPMLNGLPWWYFQGVEGRLAEHRLAAVDPEGALGRAIPTRHILGCVVYMGAAREAQNRVRWNGRKRLVLGEPEGGESPRLRRVTRLLAEAGLGAEAAPDIRRAIWAKLLGNVAHNPLSVITGATLGRLAAQPHLVAIMRAAMREAAAVAAALGITGFEIEERLQVSPEMTDFRTSMLQDFEAGRPLELGAIVEAVIEVAKAEGIETPVLATIRGLALERWLSAHGALVRDPG